CGISNGRLPDLLGQLIPGNNVPTMLQEVGEHLENPTLDLDRFAIPAQENAISIEFTICKAVQHVCAPPSGVTTSPGGEPLENNGGDKPPWNQGHALVS